VTKGKIGLFGGTFDPVHSGHMQLAEAAREEFGFDLVVFIPAGQPPHKDKTTILSFKHRVAMLKIACEGRSGFECNAIEGSLATPSYTIDTLEELLSHYGTGMQLYFLIGVDAFMDILTWKSYQAVLKLINIIISRRQGSDESSLKDLLSRLGYSGQGNLWQGENGLKDIFILQYTPDNISSSSIRENIKKGKACKACMPKNVLDYIDLNKLYR